MEAESSFGILLQNAFPEWKDTNARDRGQLMYRLVIMTLSP